jgi:AcrR family transcriptional regulator
MLIMGRWEPDARDRLERAALDLFLERGFDRTTIPEITTRAGLTTRTFFRHFADKREVLFSGQDEIPALAAHLVADAPPSLAPMEVVAQGLPALAAAAFEGRRDQIRHRKAVIDGDDGLRERELAKMARVVDAIASAFRDRGVDDLTASVVAETAVGVVKVSLRRWLDADERDLSDLLAESMDALTAALES